VAHKSAPALAHDTDSISRLLREDLLVAARTLEAFLAADANVRRIAEASAMICESIRGGNKVLAIGNGGSCADAAHFCEELSGRFRDERPALPAIACNDAGHITCTANDYGYDAVFERWVRALAKPGDVLFLLSTSGNSASVLQAITAAHEREMTVVALTGRGGGKMAQALRETDVHICVPHERTARIQEVHILILHCLCDGVDAQLLGEQENPT